MGCTSSKVDDLPAVALCRDRCKNLQLAIHHRYAFADSHLAYLHSLKQVGICLDNLFIHHHQDFSASSSPLLPLPTQRKGDPITPPTPPPPPPVGVVGNYHGHSHSNSGSHLHFHSEDEDDEDDEDEDGDDDDSISLHHSVNSTPLHHFHHEDPRNFGGGGGGGFMEMNYMRNQTTQSVVYEQRPMSSETVNMASSYNNPYSYPNQGNNHSSYPYYNYPPTYPNYGQYGGPPPYGSSPPPMAAGPVAVAAASSSKPPPPPPSPPRASAWDFLNPFNTFDKYYPPPTMTPSRDSRDVREEEGIPDLEDENDQQQVVKQVQGHPRFSDGGGNYSRMVGNEEENRNSVETFHQTRPSVSRENEEVVHLVDKNVVMKEERPREQQANVAAFKTRPGGSAGVAEVVREIRSQFERAAESGNDVLKILEAGKIPYHRKNAVHQVSSKMLHSITPSLSVVSSHSQTSTSRSTDTQSSTAGSVYLEFAEDAELSSVNLSSTLQKLYIWEKKLYEEVKAEERMRVVHERKSGRLKHLVEKGAEAQKVESTRNLVRTLSTKIRIAIQIVDKISVKINKLRDDELWPQINELLRGLVDMWRVMHECHQNQCQALAVAKSLDAAASSRNLSDANLEATMQLELEMLNWTSYFSKWIDAQKGYVKTLNGWLFKCLLYEPEETDDGRRPYSPSSIGAPPVFIICNQWSQAMERISEKEVIDAMRVFAMSVFRLWEQHNQEMRNRMMANKDMDRKVKALEREEHKMHKAVQAMDKQMVMVSGENGSSLQSGLKMIFEAMERFSSNSLQAYEDLRTRIEEERLAR